MNKIKHLLTLFLILTTVQVTAKNNLDFNLGGINISPDRMVKAINEGAQLVQNIAESKRSRITRAINSLESKRQELGAQRDHNRIGTAEYEQGSKSLDAQINRLNKSLEKHNNQVDNVGNNVNKIFMTGWEAILEHQREEHQRKTAIGTAAAKQAVANDGALERLKYLFDPNVMKRAGLCICLTTIGTFGTYKITKILLNYIESLIGQPSLVIESSRKRFLDSMKNYFFGEQTGISTFDDVILPKEINTQLLALAQDTKRTMTTQLPFRHLLLYGPPGTGKTMFARKLAQYAEMDYAIVPGANFAQFSEGKDIQELNKLFDWAKHGKNGLIIFIDEADAFLRNRKDLNDRGIKLVNAFLSRTGTSSEKFMFIFATNNPEDLDTAVLSRINKKIYFPLPGSEERKQIINLYLDKNIRNDHRTIVRNGIKQKTCITISNEITDAFINLVSQKTDGLSGRDINQMIDELRARCYAEENLTLTTELFNNVVSEKIKQYNAEKKFKTKLTEKN